MSDASKALTKPPQYMPKDICEAWNSIPEELRREPKCSGCSVLVCRPKCFFELNPANCPRHEQKRQWEAEIREAIADRGEEEMTKKKPLPPKVLKALDSYRAAVYATYDLVADRTAVEGRARRHVEKCIQDATDEAVRAALEPIHEALNSGNGTYKP